MDRWKGKKKQFDIESYDDRIEIRTNHPLKNRLIMAWGLIRYGSFKIIAPTMNKFKELS